MTYKHNIINKVLSLQLEGDLISENHGPELISIVNDAINNELVSCAIDIKNVRYVNSSGIGVLITILTKFRNKGGELVLVKRWEWVQKLLVITKLNCIFTIVPDLDHALKELIKS